MLRSVDDVRARPPILTIAILIATTLGAAAQLLNPAVFDALRRDAPALAAGQWWRIGSPLLVLDGNPLLHYATDMIVLVVVGSTLERLVGPLRTAVLFIAGAIVGQVLGYAWEPTGAGASVGICGLVGGLVVLQFVDRRLNLVASLFGVGLVVALASIAVVPSVIGSAIVAGIVIVAICAALINPIVLMHQRSADARFGATYALAVVTAGALALIAAQDNHGGALLAGIVGGLGLFAQRVSRGRRSPPRSLP